MLRLWLDVLRRKSPSTSEHVWKQPGSICWRCFGRWIGWTCRPLKSPQRLIRQLFELDADYVEALWALDQAPGSLDLHAMLRDTLVALDQLPEACTRLRSNLPHRAHPILAQLELSVRRVLDPAEAYSMVPGRRPQNG
jgi:hypothetical protein